MNSLMDTLFGPLPEYYCLYFYIISILGAVFALIALVNVIALLLFSKDGKKWQMAGAFMMIFLMYFVLYFKSRLLNTMCRKSL
tara:strand:+ start:674 stop:922 length:249 start_codon:yes stop_codon:yes gene_type:complete